MTRRPNLEQFEAWNGESGARWVANADTRDAVLAPIASALNHTAGFTAGEQVLDIGCGCGATTLAAARAVGPTGVAHGVDLSEPMLQIARQRAAAAGSTNVSFEQADAQAAGLGGPYDVAISRFGTMFFADPVAAFTNIAAHLVPGGRLCVATWQPLAANEWLVVPGVALLEFGTMPDGGAPGAPGMFAQAEPTRVTTTLAGAGFVQVDVVPRTVALTFGTVDDAVSYLGDSGPGRAVLETIPADRHEDALAAVRRSLLPHHRPGVGVVLDAGVWLVTATKA